MVSRSTEIKSLMILEWMGNEGDFYWYQILILPIRTLFPIFSLIPRRTYKSIWIFHSAILLRCPWTKRHKREENYWLCWTCKALTSSNFNGNLFFLWSECKKYSPAVSRFFFRAGKRVRDRVKQKPRHGENSMSSLFILLWMLSLRTLCTWNIQIFGMKRRLVM